MATFQHLPLVSRRAAIAVIAIAATAAVGWYFAPVTHQDSPTVPLQNIASSGVTNVAPAPGTAMIIESPTPDGDMTTPPIHATQIGSGSGIASLQKTSVDFATALQQARADATGTRAPLPPGVVSWQGMTQEQAANAFESAVHEYSRSITANPFRSDVGKN